MEGQIVNVVGLIKDREHYIFIYTDKNYQEALRALGRLVSNQELNFT